MEETILYPSPNWFLPSVLRVSEDGWLVYGGPGRSLVVLEPLPPDFEGVIDSTHRHKAHVIHRSTKDRLVSVDISPEWPEKRRFVTGSSDGVVKEWTIKQVDNKWSIKYNHFHEAHANEREDVVGVGYSKATHVISVGNFSNIIVWDLNTYTTESYNYFMRHFKATCMSCSPHMALVVAVGTKQGVVFVLDLNGKGNVVYKVRGQDDEIAQVTWCPQYEVILKRSFKEKKSLATQRLEKIRNEPEPSDLDDSGAEKKLPEDSFDESVVVAEDDMFDIYKDHETNEFGHKKYQPEDIVVKTKVDDGKNDFLAECERLKAKILKNKQEEDESIETLVAAMDKAHVDASTESKSSEENTKVITGTASLVASGSTLLQVEGTDHVHKHLLASISKNGFNVRIWSKTGKIVASCGVAVYTKGNSNKSHTNKSPHNASLHWYKAETLLIVDGKTNLLECNPLNVDCRNRLTWSVLHSVHRRGLYYVTSNAPRVQTADSAPDESRWSAWTVGQDRYLVKYDMNTGTVSAKFGTCGGYLYDVRPCPYDAGKISISVGDGALRVWENHTTGEDDNKLTPGEVTAYWQNVQGKILQCAWHPTKENLLAFSTAESRVGILDTSKLDRPAKVLPIALTTGVYSIAWGEGMALFAVGGNELVMYQANKPDQTPIPIQIEIEGQKWDPSVVNYTWRGLTVASNTGGVAIFSGPGGRALAAKFVFTRGIQATEWHPQQTSSSDEESKYKDLLALTALDKTNTIVILKYEDKEGGGKQFTNFNTLQGHSDKVLQAYWSPHRDGQILSTSQDSTVRVWDAVNGVCISIFEGHSAGTLGAAWCALPQLADTVLSGGNDFCLRLWDINCHPAEEYKHKEVKREPKKRKKNKNKVASGRVGDDDGKESDADNEPEDENKETFKKEKDIDKKDKYVDIKENDTDNKEKDTENKQTAVDNKEAEQSDEEVAADGVVKLRPRDGKRFILPITAKQLSKLNVQGMRLMLQKYLNKNREIQNIMEIAKEENQELYDLDFLKLFGNINEVNEVLDMECESHLELKAYKEYMMLMIFRGRIDSVINFANENDLLDPFLLSVAPCVSFKYWKDVTQLYVAQIDRLAVKKQEDVPNTSSVREHLPVYRKAAALLSIHDIRGAVDVLEKAKLFKEAYILCRCRHMDSIAEETLNKWARTAGYAGNLMLGGLIYLVLGNISGAATLLRRSKNQEYLNFAAELAKSAGLNTFADFIETKVKNAEKEPTPDQQTEELLEQLPTKMELLMKENKGQIEETTVVEDDAKSVGLNTFGENNESNIKSAEKEVTADRQPEEFFEELLTKKELLNKEDKVQNDIPKIVNDVVENESHDSFDNETVTDTKE